MSLSGYSRFGRMFGVRFLNSTRGEKKKGKKFERKKIWAEIKKLAV